MIGFRLCLEAGCVGIFDPLRPPASRVFFALIVPGPRQTARSRKGNGPDSGQSEAGCLALGVPGLPCTLSKLPTR
jgi:hypothetical protein